MARLRFTFTEEQCKKFEEEANPHQWFLAASLLHDQAVELYARRGQGTIAKLHAGGYVLGQWAATNKATLLLSAFALENAIKAFLIYEHPAWISDGCLHHEICNHRLVALSRKSSLITLFAARQMGACCVRRGQRKLDAVPVFTAGKRPPNGAADA